MLKKIGIPMLVLVAMLAILAPSTASAAVRFGVTVGPVYPYPAYPYAYSYPYGYGYYAPYPAPAYQFYWRGHRDHDYRDYRRHEWREHERYEYRHGYRR